jgi:hypothetical protein
VSDSYQIGDCVRLSASFRALATGALTDPTTVTFKTKVGESGAVTTYVYGTDAELVKDSTGVFHVDLPFTQAGTHYYRFVGTGAVKAAVEDELEVEPSQFEVA